MVRPPDASITAENLSWTPASENLEGGFAGALSLLLILALMDGGASIHRLDHERAGQVGAPSTARKKEFALRLDARARGQIVAQMPFRQQVRKKGRQTGADSARRHDDSARLAFVGKA